GDVRAGVPVVLLAHEALVSSWPLAVEWLKQEQSLLQARDRLARDVELWLERGRRRSLLSTAPEKIDEIEHLQQAGLPLLGAAAEFAAASIRESRNVRRVRYAAVAAIGVLSVVSVVAAVIGYTQRSRAELALFRQYED